MNVDSAQGDMHCIKELPKLHGKTFVTIYQGAYTMDTNDIFTCVANDFYMLGSVIITSPTY